MSISLGRLSLPTIGLLVGVLACGSVLAPAQAEGDDPRPAPVVETASSEAASAALDEVQSILEPTPAERVEQRTEATAGNDPRDLTLALRDLRLRQADLKPSERAAARRLVDRPTSDSAKQFGTVLVHWRSSDTTVSAGLVDQVGATVQNVLTTYAAAGYRAPLPDGPTGDVPGSGTNLLDIYVGNLGEFLYGYCNTDSPPTGTSQRYDTSAFCVFNSDYSWAPRTALENLQVTAAHELFHAVQFAYDYREDPWFMEATATWAEDEVYNDINDNRQYLASSPLKQPKQSLDQFSGQSLRQYGEWIFFRYLSERFPTKTGALPTIVRTIWERADSSRGVKYDGYSIQAVSRELAARKTTLPRVFAKFADGNRRPALTYREGKAYPTAPLSSSLTLTSRHRSTGWKRTKLNHLASTTVRIKPGTGLSAKSWALRVSLRLPAASRGTTAVVTIYRQHGGPVTQMAHLNKAGDGRTTVRFGRAKVRYVEVTLVNAGTHYRCWRGPVNDVVYSCSGTPLDNSLPMAFRVQAVR